MGFLSGVVKSVGGLMNDITGVSSANDYNTKMWQLQNEYNSPASQLARMREAGIDINPTSYALGTGNLSNTASNVSSGSPAGNPISMLMGVASGIQGIREAKQRIENMKEQNINTMTQGNNMLSQGAGIKVENNIKRKNLEALEHNLKIARQNHRPVGYAPTMYSDPYAYGKSVGFDIDSDF